MGELAGEWRREMQRTDTFWEVANLIWTAADKRPQEVDRYHQQVP